MKMLVIRPQPGADATASRAEAAGFDAVVLPLFVIESVSWERPPVQDYDALMLTSSNAVRQAGDNLHLLKDLPTHVVGTATARAAEKAGLAVESVGDAGLGALLVKIQAEGHKRLLWLAGEDRIDVALPAGMTVDVCTVYRSSALPVPTDFAGIVKSCGAVMLHSPRAATHFLSLCEAHGIEQAAVTIAALSSAIALDAGNGWQEIITATCPNDPALLSQLQSRFTTMSRDP